MPAPMGGAGYTFALPGNQAYNILPGNLYLPAQNSGYTVTYQKSLLQSHAQAILEPDDQSTGAVTRTSRIEDLGNKLTAQISKLGLWGKRQRMKQRSETGADEIVNEESEDASVLLCRKQVADKADLANEERESMEDTLDNFADAQESEASEIEVVDSALMQTSEGKQGLEAADVTNAQEAEEDSSMGVCIESETETVFPCLAEMLHHDELGRVELNERSRFKEGMLYRAPEGRGVTLLGCNREPVMTLTAKSGVARTVLCRKLGPNTTGQGISAPRPGGYAFTLPANQKIVINPGNLQLPGNAEGYSIIYANSS